VVSRGPTSKEVSSLIWPPPTLNLPVLISKGKASRRKAFTIPELLTAVMCIAILASVAIPMHFGRSDITLENACVLLARDLRTAQNNAAFTGRPMTVIFDEDGGGYRVLDESGALVQNPRTDLPFERRYGSDAVFRGVHVRMVDFGKDRSLAFDPHGFATEKGRVMLTFGDDARELFVSRDTGNVTIIGSTSHWADDGL
jgi:Tfp pilus assembly protein FimT